MPTLQRLEVANGFLSAIRRKRITAEYRDRALAELMKMSITTDTESNTYAWTTRLQLASVSGHGLRLRLFELARRHSLEETIPV